MSMLTACLRRVPLTVLHGRGLLCSRPQPAIHLFCCQPAAQPRALPPPLPARSTIGIHLTDPRTAGTVMGLHLLPSAGLARQHMHTYGKIYCTHTLTHTYMHTLKPEFMCTAKYTCTHTSTQTASMRTYAYTCNNTRTYSYKYSELCSWPILCFAVDFSSHIQCMASLQTVMPCVHMCVHYAILHKL